MPAPVAQDVATTPDDAVVVELERRDVLQQIDLVEHDELGPRIEPGTVLRELAVDGAESLLEVGLRRIEDVNQEARALEVSEELMPEASAVGRSLDEPGHVRNGQLPVLRAVDHAEDGLERRERVVGDLRLRVRDPPQERRLAGVGEAGEGGIHHELEPKLEIELLAGKARLRKARRLPRRRREARVSAATLPADRDHDASVLGPQVGDELSVVGEELGADRNSELDVVAVGAVLLRSPAAPAALGLDVPDPAERREVPEPRVDGYDDVSPAPAVTAVRPTLRDELLAAEAEAAVASTARLDVDLRAVVEHDPAEPSPALLRGCGDRDEALVAGAAELDRPVAEREDRVVATEARARAGAELRPALTHDDHPGLDGLAGEDLHTEALRLRVAPVARRSETLLVRHQESPSLSAAADSSAASAPLRLPCSCSYASAAATSAALHPETADLMSAIVMSA